MSWIHFATQLNHNMNVEPFLPASVPIITLATDIKQYKQFDSYKDLNKQHMHFSVRNCKHYASNNLIVLVAI